MKTRLYLLTFIFVAIVIIVFGYVGMTLSLDYMQKKYVELQLDINMRQAENMAAFLENQIKNGSSQREVRENLQQALIGTDADKGFLCMFDKYDAELICHPDESMLGMKIPADFTFEDHQSGEVAKTRNIILEGISNGGLYHTPNRTEVAYMVPVEGTGWMLSAHENIEMIKTEINNQRNIFLIGFGVISLITAFLATLMARIIGRRYEKTIEEQNYELEEKNDELTSINNELSQKNHEISLQKTIIEDQHEFVKQQKEQIEEQNIQITSSIQYAGRIQDALLPPERLFAEAFSDSFIYFKPRDIVSGDFYWLKKVEDIVIFAAADSTGHGVPGAFMSMLGIAFLNEIVNEENFDFENHTASMILDELRDRIKNSLRQTGEDDQTKDGMDMSIIMLDKTTKAIQYSGAYNPLYIVRNKKITEVQADKMPVGVYLKDNEPFSNKRAQLKEGDILYMFSDGFYDQFGGEAKRKFMKKNFRELLEEISELPLSQQKQVLSEKFDEWKADNDQSDDVLVAGIKI
jgi:serine phosphatase RsbU (regulator of sigma subunit)